MPVILQGESMPVSQEEASLLWGNTISRQRHADDMVTVNCVSKEEITDLNTKYRQKSKPTNVLTFSYGEGEHDIALCLEVADREAKERQMDKRDYVALLLTHAFLHATGLDHEVSKAEEKEMQAAEKKILEETGFTVNNL